MQTIEVVIDGPNQSRSDRKYPDYYLRYQVAQLFKRGRGTLNFWDSLLLIGNIDYRKNSLGHGKPWHPYQVELLAKINEYQYRGNNPQANRDEQEILELIDRHQKLWTEENWRQNNYFLPILKDDNNQRAS